MDNMPKFVSFLIVPLMMTIIVIFIYVSISSRVTSLETKQDQAQEQEIIQLKQQQLIACEQRNEGRQVLHGILDMSSPGFGSPNTANPIPGRREETIKSFKDRLPIVDCKEFLKGVVD